MVDPTDVSTPGNRDIERWRQAEAIDPEKRRSGSVRDEDGVTDVGQQVPEMVQVSDEEAARVSASEFTGELTVRARRTAELSGHAPDSNVRFAESHTPSSPLPLCHRTEVVSFCVVTQKGQMRVRGGWGARWVGCAGVGVRGGASDFVQAAVGDVVDEPADVVLVQHERAEVQAVDALANIVVRVEE